MRQSEPIIDFHSWSLTTLSSLLHRRPTRNLILNTCLHLLRNANTSKTRSKVWYKDGSVVLQAESTQFHVHWGVLLQHSDFFAADLEGLPQPNNQPTVDGCHIIELQDPVVGREISAEGAKKALYAPYEHPFPRLSCWC
jgi:hypothetical protein